MGHVRTLAGQAKRRLVADVREDPYLLAILGVALVLGVTYIWHGIPNFATWDGRDRLLDPLVVYGAMLADPGVGTLQEAVIWGREPFGATLYLYGFVLLPVVVAAVLAGEASALTGWGIPIEEFGFWPLWHATPAWIWNWSIILGRLTSVAFALGVVYLVYRIGTYLHGRRAGRLAAAFMSVTWGLVTLTHEVGEDIPSLFLLLVALYMLVQYVDTGDRQRFYVACAVGALAMGLKLTTALIVPTIGLAHLYRTYKEGGTIQTALADRELLLKGMGLGALVIVLSFPTLLVGGVVEFVTRLFGSPAYRVIDGNGPDAGAWWWLLRGYFQAFGLPLFVAGIAGVGVAILRVRERWPELDASVVLLTYVLLHVLVMANWRDFRPHHLLVTLPLILVFLARWLAPLWEERPTITRAVVALLLVSSGLYAGVGVVQYGSMPRDEAVDWMDDNVDREATMELYVRGFDEAAVPHWMDVQYPYVANTNQTLEPCPDYIQLTHRDLLYLRDIPEDERSTYTRDNTSVHAAYVRSLLNESYGYEIVAEFGEQPPNYVPDRPAAGSLVDLLELGIYPHSDQYGDEQELQANQFVILLEHTGSCAEPLPRPTNVTVRVAGPP